MKGILSTLPDCEILKKHISQFSMTSWDQQKIEGGKADVVLPTSIFHYGTYFIRQAKTYRVTRHIPIRPL